MEVVFLIYWSQRYVRRPLSILGFSFLVALGGLGCRAEVTQPPKPELPIGLITTEDDGKASPSHVMAETLFERINAAGGLQIGEQTYRLVLHQQPSGLSPESALQSAQRLLNQQRVIAFVGPNISPLAMPVAGLAERVEVPMITPSATLPAITEGRRFVFRMTPDDNQLARLMAQFIRREMPDAKVAVLFEVTNDYSRTYAKTLQQEMEGGTKSLVMREYAAGEQDFRGVFQELAQLGVDALLLPNYAVPAQLQLEQLRELQWQVQLLGTDAWFVREPYDSTLYDGAFIGRLAHLQVSDSELKEDFEQILAQVDLWASDSVILTYDALQLLFDALQRCACLDGPGIRDALALTQGFSGVGGEVSFTPEGDFLGHLAVVQVRQRQPFLYRVLTAQPED